MMWLDDDTKKAHPNLVKLVKDVLPKLLTARFAVGMQDATGVKYSKLRQALKPGQGPMLKVATIRPTCGTWKPGNGAMPATITVARALVSRDRQGRAMATAPNGNRVNVLAVTILHELMHHLAKDKKSDHGENDVGFRMETFVWGGPVGTAKYCM